MGAQAVALAGTQRAFQQRAEDAGIHFAPIKAGGQVKHFDFPLFQLQRQMVGEQPAVEAQHRMFIPHHAAGVHAVPQRFQPLHEELGVLAPGVQLVFEDALRQQACVFRKEGEYAAHQKGRHRLGRKPQFQAGCQFADFRSHLAGHQRPLARRIQARGVHPDGADEILRIRLQQIVHEDAAPCAIAAVASRETFPHMDGVADVAGEHEGRALGQLLGVVHGLAEGPLHVALVARRAAQGRGAGVGRGAALLGLQHEATLAVQIRRSNAGAAFSVGELDLLLKTVGVVESFWIHRREFQRFAEFLPERLGIGLLVSGGAFPSRNEVLDAEGHMASLAGPLEKHS